jgi:hypothetical protein
MFDVCHQFNAAHLWHSQVSDKQVAMLRRQLLKAVGRTDKTSDFGTELLKGLGDCFTDASLIINSEDVPFHDI